VESFGIPAPGQTVLITAAAYAGASRLNIAAVAAIGVLAAVIGDNIGLPHRPYRRAPPDPAQRRHRRASPP